MGLWSWFKMVDKKHKEFLKNTGYKFSKPLIFGFFILVLAGLVSIVLVDGVDDKVFVECKSYSPCVNPLKELGCSDPCCTWDFIPARSSCGERPSWLALNYNWLVILLFGVVLWINHLLYNKGYDFNKYWGDWK